MTLSRPHELVATLYDKKTSKRITQRLVAPNKDALGIKVSEHIHDLTTRSLAIAAAYGVIWVAITSVMVYVTVNNIWVWLPVSAAVMIIGYGISYPAFQRCIAWREEWRRLQKESHLPIKKGRRRS